MTAFIEAEGYVNWFQGPFSIYYCQFKKDNYEDSLYESLGINFHASLERAVDKRRAEFLVGRYCAKKAAEIYGFNEMQLDIGEHRCPTWPTNATGSISHCDDMAVSVFGLRSSLAGIGIDIEKEINADTIKEIESQILSSAEIELISPNAFEKPTLFTIAFSIKESFFKAAYPSVKKYFDFNAVSIKSINKDGSALIQLNTSLNNYLFAGRTFEAQYRILSEGKIITFISL